MTNQFKRKKHFQIRFALAIMVILLTLTTIQSPASALSTPMIRKAVESIQSPASALSTPMIRKAVKSIGEQVKKQVDNNLNDDQKNEIRAANLAGKQLKNCIKGREKQRSQEAKSRLFSTEELCRRIMGRQ